MTGRHYVIVQYGEVTTRTAPKDNIVRVDKRGVAPSNWVVQSRWEPEAR